VTFTPIDLTIMGVRFPDEETFELAANALGSAMFEDFKLAA
jgi:hypothetical protein